ncbi:hypothetical protein LCGC14_0441750 [marine sediment metagenome]|uniref:DUF7919 domain-containing protein n=1 Tax=marine sediment metagenome TaxID=412755 RepID=A0A0F9V736_9ZZZZ
MKASEIEEDMKRMQDSLNKFAIEGGHPTREYKPVAVGYLDITEDYQKGPVSQNFINKLRIIYNTGAVLMTAGHHDCEFCIDKGNYKNKATSSCEKTIVDEENNIEYKFPQMIFHYIEEHGYQPPEEFVLFILTTDINVTVLGVKR